jgi:cupin fold WbuC family metalloprotein
MQEYRKINDEVYYTDRAVTWLDGNGLAFLKARAAETPRKRTRLCAHPQPTSGLHEMIIVHGRDAYVRPHRHIGKPESLHVIEGKATVILFSDEGKVTQRVQLGGPDGSGVFYYRIESALFHMLLIESDWFVFHETTAGPFDPGTTELASWSPDGEETSAAEAFMRTMRESR